MSRSGFPCFQGGGDRAVHALSARFVPGMAEGDVVAHVLGLIGGPGHPGAGEAALALPGRGREQGRRRAQPRAHPNPTPNPHPHPTRAAVPHPTQNRRQPRRVVDAAVRLLPTRAQRHTVNFPVMCASAFEPPLGPMMPHFLRRRAPPPARRGEPGARPALRRPPRAPRQWAPRA
jgi:hypothetical protein